MNPDTSLFPTDDSEWRARLSPEVYRVLRQAGTEAPFSSPLLHEKREGVYRCAGCGAALFSSAHKYDSGSGWPSFTQGLAEGALGTSVDHKLGYPRTEVHCVMCGGHLGHVFEDGPKAAGGLRFCINGVCMIFDSGLK